MNHIKLTPECIKCLLDKYLYDHPEEISEEEKLLYSQELLKIISKAKKDSPAPDILEKIMLLQKKMFNYNRDYTEIKKHYNSLVLSLEDELWNKIITSSDSIKSALCYSVTGNYIDFGASDSINEDTLESLLNESQDTKLNENEIENLKNDLKIANNLTFLTDNCGEIALDKLLIRTINYQYPQINVRVIVRGEPVLNDATMEDAIQVGLPDIVSVTHNGSAIAGTSLDKISKKAKKIIDNSDVIIAKGQGNFETMRYCQKNAYYLFMCKCKMFSERFGVERFSPMLVNDLRMKEI